jgi:hypothetical protein
MGIWYEAKLIYGWEIDYKKAADFLIKNKVGTCGGDFFEYDYEKDNLGDDDPDDIKAGNREEQCFCGPPCFENLTAIPEGVQITKTSPHYDCGAPGCRYYVTLLYSGATCTTRSDLNNITKKTIEEARKFAIMLGGDGDEPTLFAVPNIT